MFDLHKERFPSNQWKPLQPVAWISRTDDMAKIHYEDGSFRVIPYVQDLLEQRIERELMRHEAAHVMGRPLEITAEDVVLLVYHPDWPEVNAPPQVARPFMEPRRWSKSQSKTGRFYCELIYHDGTTGKGTYARFLYSRVLGRELLSTEHVDHIDEVNTNDRIDNFQILSAKKNAEKSSRHRFPNGITMVSVNCAWCDQIFYRPLGRFNQERKIYTNGFYCSHTCKGKATMKKRYPNGKGEMECECIFCGSKFKRHPTLENIRIREGKAGPFCPMSKPCMYKYRIQQTELKRQLKEKKG